MRNRNLQALNCSFQRNPKRKIAKKIYYKNRKVKQELAFFIGLPGLNKQLQPEYIGEQYDQ